MTGNFSRIWTIAPLAVASIAGLSPACGQAERLPGSTQPVLETRVVAVKSVSAAPEASDAAPEVRLLRVDRRGVTSPLPTPYVDAVEFRGGQAAVTRLGELQLVSSDGSRTTLARHIDGLPVLDGDGSLVFAARFGQLVEISRLTPEGSIRRLASFRGSATRLSPKPDGRVVFVGADVGGVAGIWVVDSRGARCLTNCALRVGKPWGNAYHPLPRTVTAIRIIGDQVRWQTVSGEWEAASLRDEP